MSTPKKSMADILDGCLVRGDGICSIASIKCVIEKAIKESGDKSDPKEVLDIVLHKMTIVDGVTQQYVVGLECVFKDNPKKDLETDIKESKRLKLSPCMLDSEKNPRISSHVAMFVPSPSSPTPNLSWGLEDIQDETGARFVDESKMRRIMRRRHLLNIADLA